MNLKKTRVELAMEKAIGVHDGGTDIEHDGPPQDDDVEHDEGSSVGSGEPDVQLFASRSRRRLGKGVLALSSEIQRSTTLYIVCLRVLTVVSEVPIFHLGQMFGALKYSHGRGNIAAHCPAHGPACRIMRTIRQHPSREWPADDIRHLTMHARARVHQGRALGLLAAWLRTAFSFQTRNDHMRAAKGSIDLVTRRDDTVEFGCVDSKVWTLYGMQRGLGMTRWTRMVHGVSPVASLGSYKAGDSLSCPWASLPDQPHDPSACFVANCGCHPTYASWVGVSNICFFGLLRGVWLWGTNK